MTAGRLDAYYKTDVVFGLYNAGDIDVALSSDIQIARASFGWLGLGNIPIYDNEHMPQVYFPQIKELRERAKTLESSEKEITEQRKKVEELLRELTAKSSG